jgi:hypothetical protein
MNGAENVLFLPALPGKTVFIALKKEDEKAYCAPVAAGFPGECCLWPAKTILHPSH